MNANNRKELQRALDLLNEAKEIIENICSEEQDKFDNLGENLQCSEKGQNFEENVEHLDTAVGAIDDAIDEVEQSME